MKYITKIAMIAIVSIIVIMITIFIFTPKKLAYTRNLFYMDTYISVKVYTTNKDLAMKALDKAESIYLIYHELTDRFNSYTGINNIYYIKHNSDKTANIILDQKLYDLIKYGVSWYDKSNGIKNINLGNLIDVWKKYRDNASGVPTLNELQNCGSTNIKDIVLLPNNQILNNHPNIDLGSIAKGYTTELVGAYFKSVGLDEYLINAGGNVLVGNNYKNSKYRIGIQDPVNSSDIYQVVKGNNIAVVTSGGYQRYYEYKGVKYNHIIDPRTLYPANNFASVTVITNNSALGDSLSLVLFVMNLEEGKAYLKQFDNVEAIWHTNDNKIIRSSGFSKYE